MGEAQTGSESAITWGRVLRIWWLLAWRWLAGLLIIGGAIGYLVGLGLDAIGAGKETVAAFNTVVGLIVYVLWGLVVVRMALRKYYRDFRLILTT